MSHPEREPALTRPSLPDRAPKSEETLMSALNPSRRQLMSQLGRGLALVALPGTTEALSAPAPLPSVGQPPENEA